VLIQAPEVYGIILFIFIIIFFPSFLPHSSRRGRKNVGFSVSAQAQALATLTKNPRLLTSIRCNLADVAARRHDFASAVYFNREAAKTAAGLENSHAKAFALAHCEQTWELISRSCPTMSKSCAWRR
jgi:hypothetical protein